MRRRMHGGRVEALWVASPAVAAVACAALVVIAAPLSAQQRAFVEGGIAVELSMEIPVPIEEVWDAWTTAGQLVEWFPGAAQMEVTEDGEYVFGWDGWDGEWRGTYLEVDRPSRLVFTWKPPASAFPEGSYETTVTLTFEDLDGTTKFTLEHGGFQAGADAESHLNSWRSYLYNLRVFLLQRQLRR